MMCIIITRMEYVFIFFFFQAEDGIRDVAVTGVQTCALPIMPRTNAQQKSGPTPLRDSLGDADPPEQLASNDDRMNQVVFAKGKLWSGLNTVATVGGEPLVASAFFVVKPSLGSSALSASMDDQGYVAVGHENVR